MITGSSVQSFPRASAISFDVVFSLLNLPIKLLHHSSIRVLFQFQARKIEAMYGRLRFYLIYARKIYVPTHVKNTRQWKSTLKYISEKKRKSFSQRTFVALVVRLDHLQF